MLFVSVFLLSLCALSLEVLLARVFSINQWHHLSFMVISLALFGFAASGTFLNIVSHRKTPWGEQLHSPWVIHIICLLFSLFSGLSIWLVNTLPLDIFRLPVDIIHAAYLLMLYLWLSLPFFLTGLVLILAYTFHPEKTGSIYFLTMTGSAGGALLLFILLPLWGEGRAILLISMLPLVFSVALICSRGWWERGRFAKGSDRIARWITVIQPALLFLFCLRLASFQEDIKPSPYKRLSQMMRQPETRVVETRTGIMGRVDRVSSPHLRFAPGLSLKFEGGMPRQEILLVDGDKGLTLYHQPELRHPRAFPKFSLAYAGYVLAENPLKILVIQDSGGSGVGAALASGAPQITVVDPHPDLAETIRQSYSLTVLNQNPRGYLERLNDRFDVIQVESWGASIPGSDSITQNHLFTIEAFDRYIDRLSPMGVLIVHQKLMLPPARAIRIYGTAAKSLQKAGYREVDRHMAMLRNWDTFVLLVSPKPIQSSRAIRRFAEQLNFDFIWLPGMSQGEANRFNVFDQPYHYLEIKKFADALRKGDEKRYIETYPLDIEPLSDDRPFPGRTVKWLGITDYYESIGRRMHPLLLSGDAVIGIVFIEAVGISFLLLVSPFLLLKKEEHRPGSKEMVYFFAVGTGYVFMELYFFKHLTLLFGNPVISLGVVLGGILICSGIGGYVSRGLAVHRLMPFLILLVAVLAGLIFLAPWMNPQILAFPPFIRWAAACLLFVPAGLLAGLPFPIGMRHMVRGSAHRAYAWSLNGCASVLASVISAHVAISLGISYIGWCAIGSYLLVIFVVRRSA